MPDYKLPYQNGLGPKSCEADSTGRKNSTRSNLGHFPLCFFLCRDRASSHKNQAENFPDSLPPDRLSLGSPTGSHTSLEELASRNTKKRRIDRRDGRKQSSARETGKRHNDNG
ncbi:hypothetical protein TGRH88_080640 [Toxoplasma gondii]|uniref:Uncharacterized protein n=1 Tax=Toxoplasma gondii TaxID=5811 RepID=A0A7J6K655_TOXGO|nr:hypothetical protein TGRH88_080640 [Toxoplasma gondii]